MLFKMGKFYEMFEMDAHVGAEVLGLTYMKVGPAFVGPVILSSSHQTGSLKSAHLHTILVVCDATTTQEKHLTICNADCRANHTLH